MRITSRLSKKFGLTALVGFLAFGAAFGQQAADKPEQATTILAAHAIRTNRYSLTGSKEGRVSFGDFQTQTYNHFQMDADKWVREVFVLDDGKTVGASQADHTVFWDAASGRETGRVAERTYGFAHSGRKFFTRGADGKFWLYKYPELKPLRQIITHSSQGVEAFLFSPNDRYLAIKFTSARPELEETYPNGHKTGRNIEPTHLYDTETGEDVSPEPEALYHFHDIGVFSPESRYYDVESTLILREGVVNGLWRCDLTTRKVTKIKALPPSGLTITVPVYAPRR